MHWQRAGQRWPGKGRGHTARSQREESAGPSAGRRPLCMTTRTQKARAGWAPCDWVLEGLKATLRCPHFHLRQQGPNDVAEVSNTEEQINWRGGGAHQLDMLST